MACIAGVECTSVGVGCAIADAEQREPHKSWAIPESRHAANIRAERLWANRRTQHRTDITADASAIGAAIDTTDSKTVNAAIVAVITAAIICTIVVAFADVERQWQRQLHSTILLHSSVIQRFLQRRFQLLHRSGSSLTMN